jgi:D-psicose/D-tagatose/L-ribulose 3-epimerase
MKYGAHSYIFTETWTDDQLHILDTAAELGLDCFEIGIGDDIIFAPELTRARAEALGLTLIVSPGGVWPVACDLSADDPADRARGLAWHRRQVERAAELGAVAYTGALYGHPGVVKRRLPPADEYPRTAAGLAHLAEFGARYDVQIVIEPMSHFRTHVVNTPEQAMRLIGLAGHPNLGVLFDTYHMITETRDYGQALRTVGDRLWGLHACENDRGVPGDGLVPWATLFSTLREIDFDGFILMEAYNSGAGDFAVRRGMFHNVCPDGEAFVQMGLRFLTEGISGISVRSRHTT